MAESSFNVVWPKRDVHALFAAMRRAEREMGASMGGAMKMAGFQLSRTMGTSTRVSDKRRTYRIISQRRARGNRPKSMLIEVDSYRGGQKHTFQAVIEGGKREANASRFVQIGMRGLAKSSWRWAANAARTGSAIGMGGASRSAKEWGNRYGDGDSRFRGDDPFYRITNRLPYIEAAMIPGAANTALDRAARALEHRIDKALEKAMQRAA